MRRRLGAAWQQGERVDVALRLCGDSNPEMHVGLCLLRVTGRPDRPSGVALGDGGALMGDDRAQVRQRDDEPVGRRDRDGLARRRDGSGERHRAGRGRKDRAAGVPADVDPAVLPAAVRARRVEDECLQDRPVGGPGPRPGHWGDCEHSKRENCDEHKTPYRRRRRDERGQEDTGHDDTPMVDSSDNVQSPYGCSPLLSKKITELSQSTPVEVISRRARQAGDDLGGHPAGGSGSDQIGDRGESGGAVGTARTRRRR
jgi:hypothetical protein